MSQIHFFEKGEGQPLILIHGFCETGKMWTHFAEELSKDFRVICPDLPGFGKSRLDADELSLEIVAIWLEEWMEEQYIEDPIVIGHSLGGYVALALAELLGSQIKAIGLFNSTSFADDESKKEMRDRTMIFLQKNGAKKFVTSFVPQLFPENRREELASEIDEAVSQAQESSLNGLLAFTKAMRDRKDRSEILAHFQGKSLLIAGTEDGAVRIEASRAQNSLVTQYFELEGMGHMGMIEEKATTLDMVRDFCLSTLD